MFFKDKPVFTQDEKYFVEHRVIDFIPITAHYDKETLVTKNGQLLQIIKVNGFENNDSEFQKENLRDVVRRAITKYITEYKYAVYLHVIRNRADISRKCEVPFGFAEKLNELWTQQNNWDKQLVNTLYITIVRQQTETSILDPQTLFFPLLKRSYEKFFEKSCDELHELTNNLVSELQRFGTRKLTIKKDKKDGYISEPLSLYQNLVQLVENNAYAPIKDLSEYLANIKISYKFNTILIEGYNLKRYAAIFSLKQVQSLPVQVYDKLLQLGTQFIATESIFLVHKSKAIKNLKKVREIYDASGAKSIANSTDLSAILEAQNNQDKNAYSAHQVTLVVYSDGEKFFQEKLNMIADMFSELGIVAVREDFKMAKIFWSQLPGNLKFTDRISYTATNLTGALTSIHHKNMGCYNGSKWGPPVSLFRNIDGNPFYFNFHHNNNGNTLVIGSPNSGKNVLMKFFLAQSTKLQPKIFYIDASDKCEKFVEELGGIHMKLLPNDFSPIKISLFDQEIFKKNKDLMTNFLMKLIYPRGIGNEKYLAFFQALTEAVLGREAEQDPYTLISEVIENSNDESIKANFAENFSKEVYSNFFDEDFLDMLEIEDILGINISALKSSPLYEAFLILLLLKIPTILDGTPTIVVFNQSYDLFSNKIFAPLFPKWLDELTSKNALALFSTNINESLLDNKAFSKCLEHFSTHILLSNKFADKKFKNVLCLNESELNRIKAYETSHRMFLLKQAEYSIITKLNLSSLPEILEVVK